LVGSWTPDPTKGNIWKVIRWADDLLQGLRLAHSRNSSLRPSCDKPIEWNGYTNYNTNTLRHQIRQNKWGRVAHSRPFRWEDWEMCRQALIPVLSWASDLGFSVALSK
jgi:hypothetical protein